MRGRNLGPADRVQKIAVAVVVKTTVVVTMIRTSRFDRLRSWLMHLPSMSCVAVLGRTNKVSCLLTVACQLEHER